MEPRGLHLALSVEERATLIGAADNDARLAFLDTAAAAKRDGPEALVTDVWRALEDCLGAGPHPLNLALLGGRRLGDDDLAVLRLIERDEVAEVAAALASLDRVQLLVRYLQGVEEGTSGYGEEAFERAWVRFQYLGEFFNRAAIRGQAALFALVAE
jgi:hypothetical protein